MIIQAAELIEQVRKRDVKLWEFILEEEVTRTGIKKKALREKMKNQFPKEKLDMLLKSVQTINNLNVEIPNLKEQLSETEKKIEMMVSGAKIIAKNILYAGTEITIRDRKFYANRDYEKTILVLEGGEIRIGGYSNHK